MGKEQLPGMRTWKEHKLLQQVPRKCCMHMVSLCVCVFGVSVTVYGCMLGRSIRKERHSIQTVTLPISLHMADNQSQSRDTKPKVLSEQALHGGGGGGTKPL